VNDLAIREARPEELEALGQLMVSAYSSLEGFPGPSEQPAYFELLANVGRLRGPDTTLIVAALDDQLVGGIVYFADMTAYGTAASQEQATSAFRMLAVHPGARRLGVGKALARHCIELARARQHRQVVIHTTHAQQVASGMYERLGFARSPDLDFLQGDLQILGYRLALSVSA
jgi:ribosomal protein S18 acetylase RimI-like enzyme